MTAVKAHDVDRAVARRDRTVTGLLFYGPDTGRVSERAKAAAEGAVDQPDDPFQLVRLEGDTVSETPGRLADEVSTYGLFGGRRAIWVRPTTRNIAPAVSVSLEAAVADTLMVIEAGDLGRTSPLRTLCEASPRALALPCYADEARDIAALIEQTFKAEGLRIEPDARELLCEALGGDRLATRSELLKLALYGQGRPSITVSDVEAVVSDVSSLSLDTIVDAAFSGDVAAVDSGLIQLWSSGVSPQAVLSVALRHALALSDRSAQHASGEPAERLAKGWRGLHFRRQPAVTRHIADWAPQRLAEAVAILQAASLETRLAPRLAPSLASEAFFRIASTPRRSSRRS